MAEERLSGDLDGEPWQAATWFAERGIAVFPLRTGSKQPATRHGVKDATCSTKGFERNWKSMNIGVACGSASGGLLVIDCDVSETKDGPGSVRAWELTHEPLPDTWMSETPSGGVHYWYRLPEGVTRRNSVNSELGVDIRCEGGYVVAPPSETPAGRYEFEQHPDDYELAVADGNVLAFVDWVKGRKGGDRERYELPEAIAKGGRNDELYRYGASLRAKSVPAVEIMRELARANAERCRPPLPGAEVDAIANSVLALADGYSDEVRAEVAKKAEPVEARAFIDFDCDGRGNPRQTVYNCKLAIEGDPALAGRFAYDLMQRAETVLCPVPWDGGEGERPVRDDDVVQLLGYMEHAHGLTKKQAVDDAVTAVCRDHSHNPLTDLLDTLEAAWDGVKRIDKALTTCLGAQYNDYNAAVSRLMLVAGAARAYEPGCKYDYMPVLIGRQGLGKSHFLRRLALREEWFVDGLDSVEGKEAVERCQGAWLVEIAELVATKRAKDVRGVKSFITTRTDTIREAYAHRKTKLPRTFTLVGTTNDATFLTDSTGNRRFLPVECGELGALVDIFDDAASRGYFAQLWGEAAHVWKEGHPKLTLPKRLEEIAVAAQLQHTEDDPRVGMVRGYIESLPEGAWVCVPQVCEQALGMERRDWRDNKRNSNDVATIMRNTGLLSRESRIRHATEGQAYGKQMCFRVLPKEEDRKEGKQ